MPSLNTLQPEAVSHGSEITVQVQLDTGAYVVLAEAYEVDFDEDQGMMAVPTLGNRRTGYRQGRFKISGSLKVYWVNYAVRSILAGNTPSLSGNSSTIYHSTRPFHRFNIQIVSTNAAAPTGTLFNVVFEKDAIKWGESALAEETITFSAEDFLAF